MKKVFITLVLAITVFFAQAYTSSSINPTIELNSNMVVSESVLPISETQELIYLGEFDVYLDGVYIGTYHVYVLID